MALLPVVLFIAFAIQCAESQNSTACIWGRDEHWNKIINGEYQYQGDFNNAPYFHKQQESEDYPDLYLWRDNDEYDHQYIISKNPPQSTSPTYGKFAYCITATTAPWECGVNQWMVYEGSPYNKLILDPQVYSQEASCPEWNCDVVTTNISGTACIDTFDTKIARNVWSNSAGNRYFWFNDWKYKWYCTIPDNYAPNSDPMASYAYTAVGWVEVEIDSVAMLEFEYPDNNEYPIQCLSAQTSNPTIYPSMHPTTMTPSEYPTTISPSQYTTISSSANPSTSSVSQNILANEQQHVQSVTAISIAGICGGSLMLIFFVSTVIFCTSLQRKKKQVTSTEIAQETNVVTTTPAAADKTDNKDRNETDDADRNQTEEEEEKQGVIGDNETKQEIVENEGDQRSQGNISQDGFDQIALTLRRCTSPHWKGYLDNFQRHLVNDDRMYFVMGSGDDGLWNNLIPEIGVREQFKTLWNAAQDG